MSASTTPGEPPTRVFHLTTPEGWRAATDLGRVEPESLAVEGFVHCSTAAQLAGTIERHFGAAMELVIVELATEVAREVRWEESRPSELYPHLYRPIVAADVTGIHRWRRASDGSVTLSEDLR